MESVFFCPKVLAIPFINKYPIQKNTAILKKHCLFDAAMYLFYDRNNNIWLDIYIYYIQFKHEMYFK